MSGVADADPTEAFEIVDDGTRLAILRALAERRAERPRDPSLSFSELRERVGARDSGRFNYHLDRLRGRFVEKHDEMGGYVLTPSGGKVVSAVLAGAYETGEARDPVPIDGECFLCGGEQSAKYDEGQVQVFCDHGHGARMDAPPGALDGRSMEEVVALADLVAQQEMELVVDGVCPRCYGDADPRIERIEDENQPDAGEIPFAFVAVCGRCGMTMTNLVGGCVVRHPAVVSLFYDHGIDVRDRRLWELEFVGRDPVVESEDPLRLRVDVERGEDRVSLTLDETVSVVAVDAD